MGDEKKTTEPTDSDKKPTSKPPEGADDKSGAEGDKGKEEKPITLEDLDPKTKALFDSEARKARLAGETAGEAKARKEAETAAREAEEEAARKANNFEKLYTDEKTKRTEAETSATKSTNKYRQLVAAVKAGIPDALDHYERIKVTDSDDDMLADAKKLAKLAGGAAHRDGEKPPVIPDGKGGKHQSGKTPEEKAKLSQEEVNGELKTGSYGALSGM